MASSGNPVSGWMDWLGRLPEEAEQLAGKIPGAQFAVNLAQKFGGAGGAAQPQGTPGWHDQMLQKANDSFKENAEKERQREAARQALKDAAAKRQSGVSQ